MKKVEVEVEVDEKLQLLENKHKDIVIRKDSITNGELTNKMGRRATEPSIVGSVKNGHENGLNGQKSESHKDVTYNNSKPAGELIIPVFYAKPTQVAHINQNENIILILNIRHSNE